MKSEIKKLSVVVIGLVIAVLGVWGTGVLIEKNNLAQLEKIKAESKINFETVENKPGELIGYWQGVYQEAPYLHMIFTETEYKILREEGTVIENYPVLEKGTWSIAGDTIILTAETVINGVLTRVPHTLSFILEKSQNQENNLTILKIGSNPAYFYGMKADDISQLVAVDWSQGN